LNASCPWSSHTPARTHRLPPWTRECTPLLPCSMAQGTVQLSIPPPVLPVHCVLAVSWLTRTIAWSMNSSGTRTRWDGTGGGWASRPTSTARSSPLVLTSCTHATLSPVGSLDFGSYQ
jgi:hypothetical protein